MKNLMSYLCGYVMRVFAHFMVPYVILQFFLRIYSHLFVHRFSHCIYYLLLKSIKMVIIFIIINQELRSLIIACTFKIQCHHQSFILSSIFGCIIQLTKNSSKWLLLKTNRHFNTRSLNEVAIATSFH